MRQHKVGRNEPCPCGSGKKYKHCHGSFALDSGQSLPTASQLAINVRSIKAKKVILGPEVTIGMSAYGNAETTRVALSYLFDSAQGDFELILVDDCSPDGGDTVSVFRKAAEFHQNTQVFSFSKNMEYSESLNAILSHANGKYVLFLSNDIFVTPAYLMELLEVASARPDIGILRGVSNYVDNDLATHRIAAPTFQNSGALFGFADQVRVENSGEIILDDFLTGDAFLVTRDVIRKVGTFDTSFFGYFADSDFGIRAQTAGYSLALAKGAFAFHKHGANFDYLSPDQRQRKLNARWERVHGGWARFKTKYGLPADLPYQGVLLIPWQRLRDCSFDPAKHYVAPRDYTEFRLPGVRTQPASLTELGDERDRVRR